MDDVEKIRFLLNSIARGVVRHIVEIRDTGVPIVRSIPHFRYVVDCDLGSLDHRAQRAESLDLSKIDSRIESDILTDPRHFRDIELLRRTVISLRREECVVPVQKFQREIIESCVHSDASSERIDELVDRYTYDLMHEDLRVRYIVYLTGLLVRDATADLAPNAFLRPPEKDDFEETVSMKSRAFDIPPSPIKYLNQTGSILEVVFDTNSAQNKDRIETILEGLKVYFGKPLAWVLLIRSPCSLYNSRSISYSHYRSPTGCHAELGSDGVHALERFFSDFDGKVSVARTVDHVRVALGKYSSALNAAAVTEKEIADVVMGLEGLFWRSRKERGEMKKRLESRMSELLAVFGFDREEVRRIVQKAYEIRSVPAHGDILKPDEIARISAEFGGLDKIHWQLVQFLRLSLLAIIFSEVWQKDNFVRVIEEALKDDSGKQALKEMVQLPDYIDTRLRLY